MASSAPVQPPPREPRPYSTRFNGHGLAAGTINNTRKAGISTEAQPVQSFVYPSQLDGRNQNLIKSTYGRRRVPNIRISYVDDLSGARPRAQFSSTSLPRRRRSCRMRNSDSTGAHPHGRAPKQNAHNAFSQYPNPSARQAQHEAATPTCGPNLALAARARHPVGLHLTRSNGLTTASTKNLRQHICSGGTAADATVVTHIPHPKPAVSPLKSLTTIAMGNKLSIPTERSTSDDTDSSGRDVERAVAVLRKTSTNVFERKDSKSPLPRAVTTTAILVTETVDSSDFGVSYSGQSPLSDFNDPPRKARTPPLDFPPTHSTSKVGMLGDDTGRPLSASTTIKQAPCNYSAESSDMSNYDDYYDNELFLAAPQHRSSALSPTIPAPSPLPEDSPHKYGLRDRSKTPEIQGPPEYTNMARARRRSNGVEVFNEAKSLQSASSFLNGLSTCRRRAETATHATTSRSQAEFPPSDLNSRTPTTHLSSDRLRSTEAPTPASVPAADAAGRRKGHPFKATGFAYSRALTGTQLRCYAGHARLLASRNRAAPVECAVCHLDDELEHWTCSWCALRMCRFCRRAFHGGGGAALRDRIRVAELGAGDSASTSTESPGLARDGRV